MKLVLPIVLMVMLVSSKSISCQGDSLNKTVNEIDQFLKEHSDRPWYRYDYNGYSLDNWAHRNKVYYEQRQPKEIDPNLARPLLP